MNWHLTRVSSGATSCGITGDAPGEYPETDLLAPAVVVAETAAIRALAAAGDGFGLEAEIEVEASRHGWRLP